MHQNFPNATSSISRTRLSQLPERDWTTFDLRLDQKVKKWNFPLFLKFFFEPFLYGYALHQKLIFTFWSIRKCVGECNPDWCYDVDGSNSQILYNWCRSSKLGFIIFYFNFNNYFPHLSREQGQFKRWELWQKTNTEAIELCTF